MSHINPDNAIKRLLDNAQKVDPNKILIEVIQENEKALCDVLRDQMRMGLAGDGDIQPGYSPSYLNYKRSLPSYYAGGKVDFYLTGDFQKGIYLAISGTQYEFDSRDRKRTKLLDRSGEQIFQLNKLSKELSQEIVTPKYLKKYHEKLQTT